MRISEWANLVKMCFNPDPSKEAVTIYFLTKIVPVNATAAFLSNSAIADSDRHKHLGLILDSKMNFDNHLGEKILEANKGIGLINSLKRFLSRDSPLTTYITFVRSHLGYGDALYDYLFNATFSQNLECVQYNVWLAITGCFCGISR